MHIEQYPAFIEILDDLSNVIKQQGRHLLYKTPDEPLPDSYDFSFTHSVPAQKTIKRTYNRNLCTDCDRRISYKHRQFTTEEPELPYLILVHNPFLGEHGRFFQDPDVNRLFETMIKNTIGRPPSSFLVREVLRCHFGSEDINNEEFQKNCEKHIFNDINRFNLKGVLLMGQAAPLMINDLQKLKSEAGRVTELFSLPAVITPGPNRIIQMQKRRMSAEKIKSEKLLIFNALKTFKEQVMHLN